MTQEERKKSWGCGTFIAAAIIIFFVFQFIGGLGTEDDNGSNPATTTPPTTVVTEPVVPLPDEIKEVTILPDDSTDKPQQPEEEPVEPPTTEDDSIELTEAIQEAPQSSELLERHFSWEYLGDWDWDLKIPEIMYDYYHDMPRPPTRDYSVYVTHPSDDIYVERLVEIIKEAAVQKGFDEYQTVELTIAFVQSLPYTVDSATSPFDEYPRYPIETLVDGGGDCEDTSILLASLLTEMGYGVVLLSPPEHMAVGIKGSENVYGSYWEYKDDKYYYIETTGSGRRIGELPEEYAGTSANIYPLVPTPIIVHEWSTEDKGLNTELKVVVSNLGTATAYNVQVLIGFDAGNDKIWNKDLSNFHNLEPGHQLTSTFVLRPPPVGVHTRLVIQIGMGGYSVSESHSGWFDY